jgi:cystathionine beta-lyase
MQPPVYFPFLTVHENIGLARQLAPLVKVVDGNIIRYEIDFDIFEAAIGSGEARTGLFLLCNPHNPNGAVLSQDELSRLRHEVLICSDEIHSELLLGGARHTPLAMLSPEIAEKTITLVAPSKTFNTAGLFCGFAIIPNTELRERYKKTVEQMTLHVSSLGLVAAQAAFSGACDDWLEDLLLYLTANRDFLIDYVRENIPDMRLTVPQATYLSLLDCNRLLDSGKITGSPFDFFLNAARLALSDGSLFGPGGEGTVRLNFGCPRSVLEDALLRIKASL